MELLIPAFLAGVITVASPCTITLLPVIISGSLAEKSIRRPLIIVTALGISVVLFGILLRATTALITVPQEFWNAVSGIIVILLGYVLLFPTVWDRISTRLGFNANSNQLLSKAAQRQGDLGAALVGLSLGPVFSSCSPVYFFVLSEVIRNQGNFGLGVLLLVVYALGLAATLLAVAAFGQTSISKLKWLANPEGSFRRHLGLIVLIGGIFILTGFDKEIQTFLVENNLNLSLIEMNFLPTP